MMQIADSEVRGTVNLQTVRKSGRDTLVLVHAENMQREVAEAVVATLEVLREVNKLTNAPGSGWLAVAAEAQRVLEKHGVM